MDKPKVTVICYAYNHASCIRDALEGFVRQKTSFPVEVIVHDDASSDGTAAIIREYAGRYPDLLRPVFQTENQHAKGVAIGPAFCFPLVRGDYVALCEGDDYWTDPSKLQRQVDAMEANPEVDICAHCTRKTKGGKPDGFVAARLRDGVIPAGDAVKGLPIATASLLCRSAVYLQTSPMREVRFNDLALLLQGISRGGLLYLSRCMAVYRYQHPGSWSAAHRGMQRLEADQTERQILQAFDRWSGGRYHRSVSWRLSKSESSSLLTRGRVLDFLSPRRFPLLVSRLGRTLRRRFNSFYCSLRWTSM